MSKPSPITPADIQRGKRLYVAEAGIEYLISILFAGTFLAKLTTELGMSDSLTGILSSIISLGCLFQLLSLAVHRPRVKSMVVALSITNQLLFLFLYAIPLFSLSKTTKTVIFVAFILLAYLLYYFAHPKKISWLMSLVEDGERGTFTANKEIISLLMGIVFSFFMGSVIDDLTEGGKTRLAFIVCGIVVFLLTVLHTLTMIFSPEREPEEENTKENKTTLLQTLPKILQNKQLMAVIPMFILYYIAKDVAVPFFGTYQINELSLSLQLVSILTMVGSVARMLVSRFWGQYADTHGFVRMLLWTFVFLGLSYLAAALATPSTGRIAFALYYVFSGIASGGINSALINLVFDYTDMEERSDSLAICQAASGVSGFLTTLLTAPIITAVQQNGNRVLGIHLYAQQLVSLIALAVCIGTIVYIYRILPRLTKSSDGQAPTV